MDESLPVLTPIIGAAQLEQVLNLSDERVKSLGRELMVFKADFSEVGHLAQRMHHSKSVHLKLTSEGLVHE